MHARANPSSRYLGATFTVLSLAAFGCGGSPLETSANRAGVRISGQMSELSGTCPRTRFKLGSKRIATDDSSAFVDRSCSELRNGEAIEVEGGWDSDGSLAARKVRRQHEFPEFEVRGAVSELTGSCPDLAFVVGAQRFIADSNTRFKDQPCSGLRNGQSVEVHGRRRPDGSAVAREVEPNRERDRIEVLGTIRNLAGSCPNLTFSLGSDVIVTSAETRFRSNSCSALSAGRFIEVEGVRQADSRILASEIEVEDELEERQEVEITGALSLLSGICPNVSFSLRGRAVRADSSTAFERVSCAALRNGVVVEVKGAAQLDGSVLASRIKRED